mmetsp:Transcript_45655/g.121100  ORF Transcript_45655/g.121100 Transcript_45655/m.121100 type:complete len:366 (+) Transcript_45655:483-1580(+)
MLPRWPLMRLPASDSKPTTSTKLPGPRESGPSWKRSVPSPSGRSQKLSKSSTCTSSPKGLLKCFTGFGSTTPGSKSSRISFMFSGFKLRSSSVPATLTSKRPLLSTYCVTVPWRPFIFRPLAEVRPAISTRSPGPKGRLSSNSSVSSSSGGAGTGGGSLRFLGFSLILSTTALPSLKTTSKRHCSATKCETVPRRPLRCRPASDSRFATSTMSPATRRLLSSRFSGLKVSVSDPFESVTCTRLLSNRTTCPCSPLSGSFLIEISTSSPGTNIGCSDFSSGNRGFNTGLASDGTDFASSSQACLGGISGAARGPGSSKKVRLFRFWFWRAAKGIFLRFSALRLLSSTGAAPRWNITSNRPLDSTKR